MIKDCKSAYLLGDKHWYPYQSIQLKKQLDFATDFAAHFNEDEIKHCTHIETHGFKTCPRGWDGIRIKNYLNNLSIIKHNKGNFLELCRRTLLMHDLLKLSEPSVIRIFLEKGVYLGGTPGFPPFLQLFCFYTKHFTKKELFNSFWLRYNSLFTNVARHFKYDSKMLEKSIVLLDEYQCDFSSKIWYKEKGGYKEHSSRMIFEELCSSVTCPALFEVLIKCVIKGKSNSNYTKLIVNKAIREASIMANHEIVKFIVTAYPSQIDRQTCPLHYAVQGGSLKCVELLIDNIHSLTGEGLIVFPLNRFSRVPGHEFRGSAYECAKAITRSAYCIEFEEWSEYAEIIDTLKKREQEKKSKKKKKPKKSAKQEADKENNDEMMNGVHEHLNGHHHHLPNGTREPRSKLFESDIEKLQESYAQLKASGVPNLAKPSQKTRSIQTCVTSKEKSIQTISDDSIVKQLDQKDKKIVELEKALSKAKKQIDRNVKLEREITELKSQTTRQAKDLDSYKMMKKRSKEQIESITLKSEEFENVLLVEKKQNKQLRQRNVELEGQVKELKSKLSVLSKPSISDADLRILIDENKSLKDKYTRAQIDAKKLREENEQMRRDYEEKTAKLNEAKLVIRQSYEEALKLDTIIKMYPDKTTMFEMSEELNRLKKQIDNRNDFDKNGVEALNSVVIEDNINYKRKHIGPATPDSIGSGSGSFGLIQKRNSRNTK